MLRAFLLLLLAGLPSIGSAESPAAGKLPTLPDIRAQMAGTWEGELLYLDYQSGQRFGIPMRVEAELLPDGVTVFRKTTFTDPGNLVHVSSLTSYAIEGVFEAYFRNRKGEFHEYQLERMEFLEPMPPGRTQEDWAIVISRQGADDDRPAEIQIRISQAGDTQTAVKEVRFLQDGQPSGDWVERNRTVLSRVD